MLDWKHIFCVKVKGGVVKIISTLRVKVEPSPETLKQSFCKKTQELLKCGKIIVACDASVKNDVMGAWWVMMIRDKEELMRHEMHAKE